MGSWWYTLYFFVGATSLGFVRATAMLSFLAQHLAYIPALMHRLYTATLENRRNQRGCAESWISRIFMMRSQDKLQKHTAFLTRDYRIPKKITAKWNQRRRESSPRDPHDATTCSPKVPMMAKFQGFYLKSHVFRSSYENHFHWGKLVVEESSKEIAVPQPSYCISVGWSVAVDEQTTRGKQCSNQEQVVIQNTAGENMHTRLRRWFFEVHAQLPKCNNVYWREAIAAKEAIERAGKVYERPLIFRPP